MEEIGLNLPTGTKYEIQNRQDSNRNSRDSSSFQQCSSISSNDDHDLYLFKCAQTNDFRRRSSDTARHKWITENMKDGNQSDDDDPLGLLTETNNDDDDDDPLGILNETNNDDNADDDCDDSPISSRADSKSPQVLFPPDSLWEEARRDSFFEKARRDSIRWVAENKQALLQEINESQDGMTSVPDTPELKRNSYIENAPNVRVVITSHDNESSDDEPAEPPQSWIASAIRRLSQSISPEPLEKDLSGLKNQGQVALEIKEIETKRRGSQSVSPDVGKIMAEWEKEHTVRRASFNNTDTTDIQNNKSDSVDIQGHKKSYNYDQNKESHSYSERTLSDSRRNSYHEEDIYREDICRDSISPSGSLRKSISGIDDSEVMVIITSPDDESEVIENRRTWIAKTIRRLSNTSSIDDSNTNNKSSSIENINYKKNSYSSEGCHTSSESANESQMIFNYLSNNEQDSENENDETPKGWLETAIRRLSSTGEDKDLESRMIDMAISHDNSNEAIHVSEGTNDSSSEYLTAAPTDWLGTAVRKLSSASRDDFHLEERNPSIGSIDTDNEHDFKDPLPDENANGWLATAIRRLSTASTGEGTNDTQESNTYERRNSKKNDTRRKSSGSGRSGSLKGVSTIASFYSYQNEKNCDAKDKISSEETTTGWLANAMRRLSSANLDDSQDDINEKITYVERSSSSLGSSRNKNEASSRSASRTSFHTDLQDEKNESANVLSPEDTPTGWLVNAVRRLSSDPPREGYNIEERSSTIQNDHDIKTSRSASKSSIHDEEQDSKMMLLPGETLTGWLAGAVRRLSSVSNENDTNIEERRPSTESIHSNSEMYTSQESHRSRNESRSSLNDAQQDLKNTLSPEDTPTGWLVNAVRRLSSVSIENEVRTEEKSVSTGSEQINIGKQSNQGSPISRSPINNSLNLDVQHDSKNLLSPEDTPTGWLANAVRRLSSASIENEVRTEEIRDSTGSAQINIEKQSNQGSPISRSPSNSSLNLDAQHDSKNLLSPEDNPTGWLANAVRRLSSASIENDVTKEEIRSSTENAHNLGGRNSQGSHRSRSASWSSLNFDEQNYSKEILSPEDAPTGWLINAVRRLSSVSGEDINIRDTQQIYFSEQVSSSYRSSHQDEPVCIPNLRSSPAPPDTPPPPVPVPSSEEEDEDQEELFSSTIRRLSSSSRGSDMPPVEEEPENTKEYISMGVTQQLHSNLNWMTSAVRRLSMKEVETIKLPPKIQRSTSEISHQNIVKPMTNEDSNEDYMPVLISKKKMGIDMAWQNGFDWDFSQGPPDVTFCGCGFLGIYMVGVAEVLLEHRPELLQGRIGGSSVGSLVAACLVADVPLQKLRHALLNVADMAQSYTLGPLNPLFKLEEPLLQGLLEMMPQDAHIKASGRLFLSLTRLSNLANEVVSEYPSRDELLRAILCCCWLPGISSFTAPTFMGKSYIDGAFSSINPWNQLRSNLSVSAYAGGFTICPDDSKLYPYQPQVSGLGVSYNMQPANGTRAVHALVPPEGDMLDKYYHNGVYDTHIFLRGLKS